MVAGSRNVDSGQDGRSLVKQDLRFQAAMRKAIMLGEERASIGAYKDPRPFGPRIAIIWLQPASESFGCGLPVGIQGLASGSVPKVAGRRRAVRSAS